MKRLFITVVSVSLLTGLAALAWTVFSRDSYPTAAGSCLNIPSIAFNPHNKDVNFEKDLGKLTNTTGTGQFYAPVYLPHGAVIKKMRLLAADYSMGKSIKLRLYRHYGYGEAQIASIETPGSDFNLRTFNTTAISPRYVNNIKNAYFLWIDIPDIHTYFRFKRVQIFYDAP